MGPVTMEVSEERWPIRGEFRISRGHKTEAQVVVVRLRKDQWVGRGECVPYRRFGESIDGVMEQLRSQRPRLSTGLSRSELQGEMASGAARNALDCALWDLRAQQTGLRVWQLAGLVEPKPLTTAFTLSIDSPDAMHKSAMRHANRPILKVKLSGDSDDAQRVAAVRSGAPMAVLIVDANEGWSRATYDCMLPALVRCNVSVIEQPFPVAEDTALREVDRPIAVCADESCLTTRSLPAIADRYDAINVKLDKAGGLTHALELKQHAADLELKVMVGCMVSTSLSIAPAVLLAQDAWLVDLDGPLLLARDRANGVTYSEVQVCPPARNMWG